MEGGGSFFWKVLVCGVMVGGMALAQVTTGTISGTVQDSSGAVVPGVTLTVGREAVVDLELRGGVEEPNRARRSPGRAKSSRSNTQKRQGRLQEQKS